jgi:hypothetical protein
MEQGLSTANFIICVDFCGVLHFCHT